MTTATATPTRTATDKQVNFATRLLAEKDHNHDATILEGLAQMSTREISALIDALLQRPRRQSTTATTVAGTTAPIAPGMYVDAQGVIFRVQKARGSENLYAKMLVPSTGPRLSEADEVVTWEFEYAPGAMRLLKDMVRMTEEQAKAFGIQYGICCVCAKGLKDATSVALGIGPVCRKQFA